MITVFIFLNTFIFLALAFLHLYWAIARKPGSTAVLPTSYSSRPAFKPGRLVTLMVAVGLFCCAWVIVSNLTFVGWPFGQQYLRYTTLGISVVFFLRIVGDFHYMGVFKKIKDTRFARNDNRVFIPLCIVVGTLSCLIALSN